MYEELNNCAVYFSSFANVNQTNRLDIVDSTGGPKETWQLWDCKKRIEVTEKNGKFKGKLKDPEGKQRADVTKFVAKENLG